MIKHKLRLLIVISSLAFIRLYCIFIIIRSGHNECSEKMYDHYIINLYDGSHQLSIKGQCHEKPNLIVNR